MKLILSACIKKWYQIKTTIPTTTLKNKNSSRVHSLFPPFELFLIFARTLVVRSVHITDFTSKSFKVSVNENFSTLLDFVFFFYFGHEWVLYFILAEKENQKVLFNPSKMSLF